MAGKSGIVVGVDGPLGFSSLVPPTPGSGSYWDNNQKWRWQKRKFQYLIELSDCGHHICCYLPMQRTETEITMSTMC